MLGRVDLFNKQVVFRLRMPDTFTKQVEFGSTHIADYLWFDATRTQPMNTNCHPYQPVFNVLVHKLVYKMQALYQLKY